MLWLRDDGSGTGGLSAGMAGVALTQSLQLVGMFQVGPQLSQRSILFEMT